MLYRVFWLFVFFLYVNRILHTLVVVRTALSPLPTALDYFLIFYLNFDDKKTVIWFHRLLGRWFHKLAAIQLYTSFLSFTINK